MAKPLIDINDLAAELKIATKTIRNRLANKSWPIPPIRIGLTLRWRPRDVTRALVALTEEMETATPHSSTNWIKGPQKNKTTVLGKKAQAQH